MTADHTGSDGLEKPGSPPAPYLRLKARESLGDEIKGTSSWSILKELKLSLVDGGVSLLKQGISKLTGTISGVDLGKSDKTVPASADSSTQADGEIATTARTDNDVRGAAELPASQITESGRDEAAFGFDWLDNLMEELDASKPVPGEHSNDSGLVPAEPLNKDGNASLATEGESEDEFAYPGV